MKFWHDVEYVGCVKDIDSLANQLGFTHDEVCLVDIDYDVESTKEYFGGVRKMPILGEFGGFFIVALDGDYEAVWAFPGSIAYNDKSLFRIHWKLIDENERRAIQRRLQNTRCATCDGLPIEHAAYKNIRGRWVVTCERKAALDGKV